MIYYEENRDTNRYTVMLIIHVFYFFKKTKQENAFVFIWKILSKTFKI